nr:MAG TPA: hypothetical protein [Caudoviricetes sp.]
MRDSLWMPDKPKRGYCKHHSIKTAYKHLDES